MYYPEEVKECKMEKQREGTKGKETIANASKNEISCAAPFKWIQILFLPRWTPSTRQEIIAGL